MLLSFADDVTFGGDNIHHRQKYIYSHMWYKWLNNMF
jgi:hypothetical protein